MAVNIQYWNWQNIKGNKDSKCAVKLGMVTYCSWLEAAQVNSVYWKVGKFEGPEVQRQAASGLFRKSWRKWGKYKVMKSSEQDQCLGLRSQSWDVAGGPKVIGMIPILKILSHAITYHPEPNLRGYWTSLGIWDLFSNAWFTGPQRRNQSPFQRWEKGNQPLCAC